MMLSCATQKSTGILSGSSKGMTHSHNIAATLLPPRHKCKIHHKYHSNKNILPLLHSRGCDDSLVVPRSIIWTDPVTTSYFIGKGVILFTMFYCSMNWWYYKRTREDMEDDDSNNTQQ